jgi:ribose 5-phosphate isomerase B
MKKLITEADILKFAKTGNSVVQISKDDIITPLAADRIKILGLTVVDENISKSISSELFQFKNKIKIAIASDHTGFRLKSLLKPFLIDLGIEVIDLGTNDEKSCDYPDFAILVAEKVKKLEVSFGVLIDATGIPSSITANKFKGIRAATCYNEFSARSAREHNDANILVLGAKSVGDETNKLILQKFLETNFAGERHQKRLDKITLLEKKNFKE